MANQLNDEAVQMLREDAHQAQQLLYQVHGWAALLKATPPSWLIDAPYELGLWVARITGKPLPLMVDEPRMHEGGATMGLDSLDRRTFTRYFLTVTGAWSLDPLSSFLQGNTAHDQAMLAVLDATTQRLVDEFSFVGRRIQPAMLRHADNLNDYAKRASTDMRKQLLQLQALTLGHAGFIDFFEFGAYEQADGRLRAAQICAARAGNPALSAWVLGKHAHQLIYARRYADAVQAAQTAINKAGKAGVSPAKLLLHQAEAHALAGLETPALRKLEDARQEFNDNPENSGFFDVSEQSMQGYEGVVPLRLRRYAEAETHLHAAIEPLPAGHVHRAVLLADLASAYLGQGEVVQAAATATSALQLAAQVESHERIQRILKVVKPLEWRHGDLPEVKTLAELARTVVPASA